jgi:FMN phosphatase YigB (HAD superfamily)
MAKPTIAIDIDDVLADSAKGVVNFSNKRWGTNLEVKDYQEHWSDMWGVDHSVAAGRLAEMVEHKLPTTYDSSEQGMKVLRELHKEYRLIIVTSRLMSIQKETKAWLDEHYGDIFDEIIYSGFYETYEEGSFHRTKDLILKEKDASYFIDDQLKHCVAASKVGIKSLLFGDYPWNQAEALPNGVQRVKNWQAVKEYFDEEGKS